MGLTRGGGGVEEFRARVLLATLRCSRRLSDLRWWRFRDCSGAGCGAALKPRDLPLLSIDSAAAEVRLPDRRGRCSPIAAGLFSNAMGMRSGTGGRDPLLIAVGLAATSPIHFHLSQHVICHTHYHAQTPTKHCSLNSLTSVYIRLFPNYFR